MENVNKTNENEEIILHLLKTKYYDMTVIGAFEKLVEDLVLNYKKLIFNI